MSDPKEADPDDTQLYDAEIDRFIAAESPDVSEADLPIQSLHRQLIGKRDQVMAGVEHFYAASLSYYRLCSILETGQKPPVATLELGGWEGFPDETLRLELPTTGHSGKLNEAIIGPLFSQVEAVYLQGWLSLRNIASEAVHICESMRELREKAERSADDQLG